MVKVKKKKKSHNNNWQCFISFKCKIEKCLSPFSYLAISQGWVCNFIATGFLCWLNIYKLCGGVENAK